MANYYVDLSLAGTGHVGTSGDPWSYDDWQLFLQTSVTSDSFFMRGSAEAHQVGVPMFNEIQKGNYQAWDLGLYGPWRIKATGTNNVLVNATTVKDLILDLTPNSADFNPTGNFYNCYFRAQTIATSSLFVGCLIEATTQFSPAQGVFTDCVIKAPSYVNPSYTVTLNRCATSVPTGTPLGGNYTLSDCQTDWVAPTLPAWDADQSAFATSTLFADVDTPPQPGLGFPTYTGYTTDLWGNPRTGIGTGLMSAPPIWASTYPKAGAIGGNTVEILAQTNETGMAYFVVLPDGDTGPSSAQVKDGLNSLGITGAVGTFGSVSLDANTEASMGATGLVSETAYDIWVVAENAALDLQEFPTGINITTADITPPTWEVSPSIYSYAFTGADFAFVSNETGMAYFITVPDGETGPSSVQVKDGVNYAGVTGAVGLIGNAIVGAGETGTLSTSNLTPNTSYDVYVVAEDDSLNLQASPVQVGLTTQGPPIIMVQPSPISTTEGNTATFSVTATGDPAITSYQWQNSSGPLVDGGRISGATTNTLQITDVVVADTDLYFVVISNGALPNTQSNQVALTVTDVVGPVWENSTPAVSTLHGVTVDFSVQSSETGNAYFVALVSGASAPSSAEVKAGTGAGGATPVDAGSVAVTASTPAELIASGLSYETAYDVYFVAEDTVPNLQATPTLVSVTTLGNIIDIPASIGIYKFQIIPGAYAFEEGNRNVILNYTGYGNPTLTANLSSYLYSVDSGATWHVMTPKVGTVVTGLSFTASGTACTFTWTIKDDLGDSIYNKEILVRLQAVSGSIVTAVTPFTLYFRKQVVNAADIGKKPPLPPDYSGISGGDLLVNAPKPKK